MVSDSGKGKKRLYESIRTGCGKEISRDACRLRAPCPQPVLNMAVEGMGLSETGSVLCDGHGMRGQKAELCLLFRESGNAVQRM